MAAGRLNAHCVILRPLETRSAVGEATWTWVSYCTGFGEVRELPGAEQVRARQTMGRELVRVRMRYQAGVLPEMMLKIDAEQWNIRDVDESERHLGYMTLTADRAI